MRILLESVGDFHFRTSAKCQKGELIELNVTVFRPREVNQIATFTGDVCDFVAEKTSNELIA